MAPIKRVGWTCRQYVNNYFWWGPKSRGSAPVERLTLIEDRYAWPGFYDKCQIYRSVLWSRSPYWQRNGGPPGRWMGNFPQGFSCLFVQVQHWSWWRTNEQVTVETSVSCLNFCLSTRRGNKSLQLWRVDGRAQGGMEEQGGGLGPPWERVPCHLWHCRHLLDLLKKCGLFCLPSWVQFHKCFLESLPYTKSCVRHWWFVLMPLVPALTPPPSQSSSPSFSWLPLPWEDVESLISCCVAWVSWFASLRLGLDSCLIELRGLNTAAWWCFVEKTRHRNCKGGSDELAPHCSPFISSKLLSRYFMSPSTEIIHL